MIERVADNIYRIGVPLPGNPLKETNAYFIRGAEGDLLVDTGFRREECREALMTGLKEAGARQDRLDVLLTHVHADHSGLAAEMAGRYRRIYMSRIDMRHMEMVLNGTSSEFMKKRLISEGFPKEIVNRVAENNPAWVFSIRKMDDRFIPLDDGDVVEAGGCRLKTILVPGHTPGNAMFWLEEQRIMFTGDHILFDITPNITAYPDVDDSLGDYLKSLEKAAAYSVKLALPGHRQTGDYGQRIGALLEHHRQRIAEAKEIVERFDGLTAYEIAGRMTWRIQAKDWASFPETQKWYAVRECLSHLDYLCRRNHLKRTWENGTWRYHSPIEVR